jgi:lipopolysaccharide biosynthesis protein
MTMTWRDSFRLWRRNLKATLPYVRRREHRILQRKYDELVDGMGWNAPPASTARITAIKPIAQPLTGEVCFFVTFAARPQLKHHVRVHIEHMLRAGIHVVLVVNTELPHAQFVVEPALLERLAGAFVRQNAGFDFAAWAHLYALCEGQQQWTRLYLVNDSIVGPMDAAAFDRIVERIRASRADFVGLTQSKSPLPHVQSFFLVFNASALRSAVVQDVFQRIVSLPTKDQVIDVYETRLTQVLTRQGLRCEALFPPLTDNPYAANDTFFRWDQLLRAGFPYVKASVLKEFGQGELVRTLVPAEFRQPES